MQAQVVRDQIDGRRAPDVAVNGERKGIHRPLPLVSPVPDDGAGRSFAPQGRDGEFMDQRFVAAKPGHR